jgi:DNA repair photolyase
VRRLREAGLTAGVLGSPVLPGITDTREALDRMASAASAARASFFAAEPLFLKSCSRPTFLSFVREHFPHLEPDYAARFANEDFASSAYRRQLGVLVEDACRRHGLGRRSTDALLTRDVGARRKPPLTAPAVRQAEMFA